MLTGSREGLGRFPDLIHAYLATERSSAISEHEHLGPHMYLEISTSDRPGIDGHAISGNPSDLARLASIVRAKLTAARAGAEIEVSGEYAPAATYHLVLNVREDTFDPASLDQQL